MSKVTAQACLMMMAMFWSIVFPMIWTHGMNPPTAVSRERAATTYYVSPGGNDLAGDGTTLETAWLTPIHALAHAGDGDEIILDKGVYRLDATMAIAKPVLVRGIGSPEETIVDGRGAVSCLTINHPGAVVAGLTIRNGYGNPGGALVEAGILRNCIITSNLAGSHTDHSFIGGVVARSGESLIENCVISGNRGGRWGVGGGDVADGAVLRNCLVEGNWVLGANANGTGGVRVNGQARIENCTVVGNLSPDANTGGVGGISAGNQGGYLHNNIVFFNQGRAENDLAGNIHQTSSHNLAGNWPGGLDQNQNSTANPRFVRDGNGQGEHHEPGDYRLMPGSPGINAGANREGMDHATDLAGNPRVGGEIVDVGAYEFPFGPLTAALHFCPPTGFVGETSISFSAAVEGENTTGLHYAWDFNGDGEFELSGFDQQEVVHVYPRAGLMNVRLQVRNATGEEAEHVLERPVRIGVREVYVACAGQKAISPYNTWETAAQDLQSALPVAVPGTVVWLGKGVHRQEATAVVEDAIRIEGADGAEQTYLDGRGLVRCIRLKHPDATILGITIINDGADNVMDFGAVGDGEVNDAPAIRRALAAGMGGTVFFPPGIYRIDAGFAVTMKGDLTLKGVPGETILLFRGDHSLGFNSPSLGSRPLTADAARGDATLHMGDVAGIEPGDLASVSDATIRETGWNRCGRHLTYVTAVNLENQTVEIAHPLNFAFKSEADAKVGFHRPAGRLRCDGLDLVVGDPGRTWSTPMLTFNGLQGAEARNLRFLGVRRHGHNAMAISGCLDTSFRHLHFDKIVYGVLVSNSRNTCFADIESYHSRHPVTPADWSDGIYVDGLRGDNNTGIMDAHPSFNIHYHNVFSGIEHSGASNLRSVGGSIRNSIFISRDRFQYGPYFQSVALVDPEIHQEYEFLMENVHWEAWRPVAISHSGKVTLRNVRCVDLTGKDLGVNVGAGVKRLVLENTMPGNIAVANVNVFGENRLNAIRRTLVWHDHEGTEHRTENGYVIDFQNNLLSRERHLFRAHGQVFSSLAGEPLNFTLRIYDGYTGKSFHPSFVFGILKLKAIMAHANAGGWQMLEQHYQFSHKRVQRRGLMPSFQTTPVYTGSSTEQPNATMKMTLANPVNDDSSGSDLWFQVDVDLSSGRTNPNYQLFYEIELYGR